MPFVTIPGVVGKVYVPDEQPEHEKKHNCKDCFSCQHCSDDRCELCRGEKAGKHRVPSPANQNSGRKTAPNTVPAYAFVKKAGIRQFQTPADTGFHSA